MEQYSLESNFALLGRLLVKLDHHQGMVQDIAKQMQQLKLEILKQEKEAEAAEVQEMLKGK